ncbi:39S ribosomal protein L18, mitochondrial, variant 2 [Schistosoma haematobium]|uniref:39S ribosomal protein L18, mitochondrial, variant 2 n=1 Tax=Schistosoma haematobium TaxID=6185 RepID=A0A922LHD2_SCHHA|nr:39S ribosomal protein L18, mitochondrial, variant 2 [Schistosoma haematobium]KAH9584749.1 39S ribosomal protein L18, mitochondrial, variant 2 [Schistosoma haematobium]
MFLRFLKVFIIWKGQIMLNDLLNSCAFSNVPKRFSLKTMSTLVYRNKNPRLENFYGRHSYRNLELLGLAPKMKGWEFQAPRKDFWNKVVLNREPHNTTGLVVHASSKVLISASTKEVSIRKHLYSCIDVSAAENVGRVLALRCHQCGFTELFSETSEIYKENESVCSLSFIF